jgi:hypothetical protein
MRPLAPILLSSVLLLPMAAAAANGGSTPTTHYRWRDALGVVHFADTIPASALGSGYDIVNDQGMVIRHVDREMTPAERRAAAAEAARAAAVRNAARQRELADSQLLAAYPSEADLRQSQQAQLKQFQFDIDSLQTNLRSQEQTLTDLLAHAADVEHSGETVTHGLQKRIADQRQTVNGERDELARKQNELASTRRKFAAELKHYRELRAKADEEGDGANQ